ncbi:unnamed protein product [Calicophoron daubneyi]|uniref:Protein kinase domain-containing protein n=1 Tax=Calicophoron daubneyi TaxID=300641 RepID=A0AAV2TXP5_CALDB
MSSIPPELEHLQSHLKDYEVIEKLGNGSQGISYKMRSLKTNKFYVLKTIECRDRSHSELIYKELTIFRGFRHAYVPTPIEVFVTMTKEDSAIYISFVRPYIDAPTLREYLRDFYNAKSIKMEVTRGVFGCLLDVLVNLKRFGYLHRNINPDNVFIKGNLAYTTDILGPNLANYIRGTERSELCFDQLYHPELIANQPIECNMTYAPKRRIPKHIEWCAPETKNFVYTEKSDLWSLACLIRIMLNVKNVSEKEMVGLLEASKVNPNSVVFEPMWKRLVTEKEFDQILSSLIDIDPDKRMSLQELAETEFVKQILQQTNPEAIARAKRRIMTVQNRPLPVEHGESAVRDYLFHNWKHERCAQEAVVWFAEHTCFDKAGLPESMGKTLLNVLELHKANEKLVEATLIVLTHAIKLGQQVLRIPCFSEDSEQPTSPQNKCAEEGNEIRLIISVMEQNLENIAIQNAGLKLFDTLISANHPNITIEVVHRYLKKFAVVFECFNKYGLMDHLVRLLNSTNLDLVHLAINYLWKFCIYEPNAMKATENNAIKIAIFMMRTFPEDISLFTGGPLLILALSPLPKIQKQLHENPDTVSILLQALTRFRHCKDTIWNVCLALNAVIHASEEFALKFVGNADSKQGQSDGFEILCYIYKTHNDNTEVIEALLRVIGAVMQYDDIILANIEKSTTTKSMLSEICDRFKTHKILFKTAQDGLNKLAQLAC